MALANFTLLVVVAFMMMMMMVTTTIGWVQTSSTLFPRMMMESSSLSDLTSRRTANTSRPLAMITSQQFTTTTHLFAAAADVLSSSLEGGDDSAPPGNGYAPKLQWERNTKPTTTTTTTTRSLNHIIRSSALPSQQQANMDTVSISPLHHEKTPLSESSQSRRMFGAILLMVAAGSTLLPEDSAAAAVTPESENNKSLFLQDATKSSSIFPPVASSEMISEAASASASAAIDWNGIFQKASKRALGGGKAGASAAVVQVLSLMWLRTSMNYQYAKGGNLASSLKELWNEGGIPRLYQGLPFALVQGPLTRFGDTAANVGIFALLESTPETQSLPLPVKTALGSVSAGLWRIFLMPIDASKTAMQVEGKDGLQRLWGYVAEEGPAPLYYGALAQASATAAGHFPWFLTYNFVDASIPTVSTSDDLLLSLARSALLGLCASCVSDVTSNSLRVIKTTKQTARLRSGDEAKDLSYSDIVKTIIETDGVMGLLGRGLQTRLLTNAIQGAVFSVLWKYFQSQS